MILQDGNSQHCPNSEDNTHCDHWWDGAECCRCAAPRITRKEARDLGWDDEEWKYFNELYPPRKHKP